jgi:hypothetical protein
MHRDSAVIFLGLLVALVAGALLMFSFKEGALAPVMGGSGLSVIGQGPNAAMMERRENLRVKNADELAALWVMAYGTAGPELPRIDFAREEVLAAFDGTHPSGGYAVAIESVVDEPGKRTVTIRRTSPGENCVTASVTTSPFSIVRVAKSALPITRTEIEEVVECQ